MQIGAGTNALPPRSRSNPDLLDRRPSRDQAPGDHDHRKDDQDPCDIRQEPGYCTDSTEDQKKDRYDQNDVHITSLSLG
jgi:hypothetical protein